MTQSEALPPRNNQPAQWSRRTTLAAIAVFFSPRIFPSTAVAQVFSAAPAQPSQAQVEYEWEMPRRYGASAAKHLGVGPESIRRSPNDDDSRGGPLLVIIVGVIALVWLAEAILRLRREIRYGGIIVEDRGSRLRIRNDPRLPGRVIIIKDKNGVTVKELSGSVTTGELINALPRTAGRGGGS
jgi:hypothetical protein